MRKFLTTLAAVGLLASACGSDDPVDDADPTPIPTPTDEVVIDVGDDEIVLTSALSGFDDCAALLDHLRTEGAERVGPWGFDDGWYGGPWPLEDGFTRFEEVDTAIDAEGDEAAPSTTTGEGGNEVGGELVEGVDFSGTNIQEEGVDEADVVKTDGDRIYIVANGEFVVVDVESREVIGSVTIAGGNDDGFDPAGFSTAGFDNAQLFVAGDEVLLIAQSWFAETFEEGVDVQEEIAGDAAFAPDYGASSTMITRISIDDGNPEVIETMHAEGDYVSARAVDGTARIIVRSNPQYNFPFVYPAGEAGEERAEEANREAILDSELSDWIPDFFTTDADGDETDRGQLVPCDQVHGPTEFAGFGVLSVLTIDVDGSLSAEKTSSVLAPGDIVYASPESVYVATTTWLDQPTLDAAREQIEENISTSIHRFDITSDESAAYRSSGSVDGVVRDSFSFSEHEDHLRVVTTSGTTWDQTSESFVRVLREEDDELVEVGSVGNLGNGEAVQSVRFQGDIGYVVTFRQIDPLYTVDLTDPTNPEVRGELKIPGFSSYLHPIGNGLVIGVGTDADETTGQSRGSKVSLFDVNDLDNPQEVAVWTMPNAWNEVGWDTHAFLWWPEQSLVVLPVQAWTEGEQWAGAVVLKIEGETISEVGRIDHRDPSDNTGATDCRVLGAEDLPTSDQTDFESEIEFMLSDGYALILDCGQDDAPRAAGYDCYQEEWLDDEAARIGLDVDGSLVTCYPIGTGVPPIARSMVLPGNELWTVSTPWGWLGGSGPARLQINDLSSLDLIDSIDL